jgi:predicted nucleotidyltransferase
MEEALRSALRGDDRIAYAFLFGSAARGESSALSDIDIAIGLRRDTRLEPREIGDLTARLERAAERPVDLVLLDEAPPPLAYRVFRDGHLLIENDRAAWVERKARAILEYLDFKPIEEICARAVLEAASNG